MPYLFIIKHYCIPLMTYFFNQLVSEPTRYRHGKKSYLLDLVLNNNSYIVNYILIADPIGKSDHATIIVNLGLDVDVDVYEDAHNYRDKTSCTIRVTIKVCETILHQLIGVEF